MKIIENNSQKIIMELDDTDMGRLVYDDLKKFTSDPLPEERYSEIRKYLESLLQAEKIAEDLIDILLYTKEYDLIGDEKTIKEMATNYEKGAELKIGIKE